NSQGLWAKLWPKRAINSVIILHLDLGCYRSDRYRGKGASLKILKLKIQAQDSSSRFKLKIQAQDSNSRLKRKTQYSSPSPSS
ncbi:MAG: hypothetical protein ACRDA8_08920, partial [Shewanella sp.]